MGSARRSVPAEAEPGTASNPNQLRISYIGYVEPGEPPYATVLA